MMGPLAEYVDWKRSATLRKQHNAKGKGRGSKQPRPSFLPLFTEARGETA